MSLRPPKRKHPEHMCCDCRQWSACHLDWGECWAIAEFVPGDQYQLTYAYGDCWFLNDMWEARRDD